MFDPGGSTDRLRACPFLGTWRACFVGGFRLGAGWSFFWQKDNLGILFSRERYKRLLRIAVDRCFSAARLV